VLERLVKRIDPIGQPDAMFRPSSPVLARIAYRAKDAKRKRISIALKITSQKQYDFIP
jgi:hypothetical protein